MTAIWHYTIPPTVPLYTRPASATPADFLSVASSAISTFCRAARQPPLALSLGQPKACQRMWTPLSCSAVTGNLLDTGIDLWHQGRAPSWSFRAAWGYRFGECLFLARPNRQGIVEPHAEDDPGRGRGRGPPGETVPAALHCPGDFPDQDTRARIRLSAVSPAASTWSPLLCPHPNGHMRSPICGLLSSRARMQRSC